MHKMKAGKFPIDFNLRVERTIPVHDAECLINGNDLPISFPSTNSNR